MGKNRDVCVCLNDLNFLLFSDKEDFELWKNFQKTACVAL